MEQIWASVREEAEDRGDVKEEKDEEREREMEVR